MIIYVCICNVYNKRAQTCDIFFLHNKIMCDEQWTQRERTTFFWVGGEEKKNVNRFFSLQKKKKNTVDIYFFFMATRFDLIFRNA